MPIARSAEAVTVVGMLEELLAGTGSGVVLVTVAEFDSEAPWTGATTDTEIGGADVPAARAARVHVTVSVPSKEHAQPVPAAEVNVTPDGRVSVTVRAMASEGPALATARV